MKSKKDETSILDDWTRSISDLLEAAGRVSPSITKHSDLLGDARELFIRDILKNFLPQNLIVGSGVIIDQSGKNSKQIDIIIYRNDFPIYRTLGSSDIFLIEGVIATIEVKSTLDANTLKLALENCKSVKNLTVKVTPKTARSLFAETFDKYPDQIQQNEEQYIQELTLPHTYIFGYKGYKTKLAELTKAIDENSRSLLHLPEVIVTEGCVCVKNLENKFSPESSLQWQGFKGKKDSNRIKYLLKDLVEKITRVNGPQKQIYTSLEYTLDDYFHLSDTDYKDWQNIGDFAVKSLPPIWGAKRR